MNYQQTDAFLKDFKRLLKRFKSLEGDLETAKKNAIELFHVRKINNLSVFSIPQFHFDDVVIYKLKKFACRALKGGAKSGIRVIYAYFPADQAVVFLEIYYKGDQEREDQQRIKNYLASLRQEQP